MFIIIVVLAIFNTYKWIVCGKQYIKISTSNKAYTNSDLYVSIIAQDQGIDLETKTKIKLLNSDGKKVKNAIVSYEGSNAKISIPEIASGNYFIEATVSSKAGKDTIQKEIYITDGNQENITITLDKGIYKPGDTVNFRALLINKENDNPIIKDVNVGYDGNDNKVYNEKVKTSEYGILSGSFTLANEVNSGIYKIVIKTNTNETTKSFKVNPYITPKYEVKIDFDKQKYLVGSTATINLNAKYFFGEPVAEAKYNSCLYK
ncbi:MAG: MG2 domain-containing protein [Clostridia bacterium]